MRAVLLVAAALVAAGVGDPLVESLSGTGAFGPGYADTNHLGVAPVLIAAFAVLLAAFVVWCADGWQRARRGERAEANRAHAERNATSLGAELTLALVLELAFVFIMEWAEALLTGGQLQHGLGWLGAPAMLALSIYACVACAALAVARLCLSALAHACTALVRATLDLITRLAAGADDGRAHLLFEPSRDGRRSALLVRRGRGRAPPASPSPA
jgi:hypothetical protein